MTATCPLRLSLRRVGIVPSGTPPDLIIEAPVMQVPADGESPWWYAYVKLPFEGDVWLAASQVVPGNRGVVHHVMVTSATLPPDATARCSKARLSGSAPKPAGGAAVALSAAGPRGVQSPDGSLGRYGP